MAVNYYLSMILTVIVAAIGFSSPTCAGAKDSTAAVPVGGTKEMCTYRSITAKLGQYKAVLIEPAAVNTSVEKTEKTTDFLLKLKDIVNTAVEQSLRGTDRFQTVATKKSELQDATNSKYLICRPDVAVVYTNPNGARFMAGYGSGMSRIIMVLSLVDSESGELILKYTGWGRMYNDFGMALLDRIRTDVVDISGYFASLVKGLPD